jgi:hypothetical protein
VGVAAEDVDCDAVPGVSARSPTMVVLVGASDIVKIKDLTVKQSRFIV